MPDPIPASEEISELRRQLSDLNARLARLTGEAEPGLNPLVSITDAFLAMDAEWRFTYLNTEAERLLARPKETLLGRVAWEEFPEAAGSVFQQQYQRAKDEDRMVGFEAFFEPLDTWFHIRAYPSMGGVAVCFQDITALKRLEACRLQHASLLERVATDAPAAEVMAEAVRLIEAVHPRAMASILLVDRAGRMRVAAAPRIPPAYNAAVDGLEASATTGSCGRAISTGEMVIVEDIAESPLWEGFHEVAAASGLRSCWSAPIFAGAGPAAGSFGVYTPGPCAPMASEVELVQSCARLVGITLERDRLSARLREQASLMDQAREAIIARDIEGRILHWSKGAERIYGWTAAEAAGRRVQDLIYTTPERFDEVMALVLARGEWNGEIEHLRKDGRTFTADCHWTLVRDSDGAPESVLAINADATQRIEMERKLRQAQRLEVVGQLTGGVAHDFNNLLTVILGNADLLAESLKGDARLLHLAEMTRAAAESGAELTKRLLAFARRQALRPKAVDINALLGGMDGMLRRTLGEHIEIEYVRGAGLWPAVVDPTLLENAVLNLCINARDAMPRGGRLTLETANAAVDRAYADEHPDVEPGQYVMVAVSDTGTGIAPEHLARVFEPFFTTKEPGRGTGLGLSMVYGFAKQSKGHLSIYSEQDQGTTLRLYLPRAHEAAAAPPREPLAEGFRGRERILLVEDNELVRAAAEAQLRGLGYEVATAANGPEAMEKLRRGRYALLFTDVVMPGGMTGRDLADAALALHPGLKVLYTSGYTGNAIVHHGRLDPGVHLLNKPYRQVDLARKVREVLDEGSS